MSTFHRLRVRAAQLAKSCCLIAVCHWASISQAHVGLDSPNGGELLVGGAQFSIDWQVEISHNTLDWDLWYSTSSSDGPWLEIAADLAAGNTDGGSPHSFEWIVPNINAATAWVRVRQDNAGRDYEDVSDASFSIEAMLGGADFTGNGTVDATDLFAWEQGFGILSTAVPTDGDANLDGDVDGADFLTWQSDFDRPALAASIESVPEPAATALLLLGLAIMLWQHRTRAA